MLAEQFAADRASLRQSLQQQEVALEEIQIGHEQVLETARAERDDLRQQIDSLEKQLKANRSFLEVDTNIQEYWL